nr:SOD [Darna trima granulovirus]
MKGICVIGGDVTGVICFDQPTPNTPVRISGYINNLPSGNHGFHIHEFGDVTNGCTSAGEHYNPYHKQHGGPNSLERHMGDLGNVYSSGSSIKTYIDMSDNYISLYGPYSVLGRSLVIHAMEDDYGTGTNELSKTTGNSGSRLGCGIIGIKEPKMVSLNHK